MPKRSRILSSLTDADAATDPPSLVAPILGQQVKDESRLVLGPASWSKILKLALPTITEQILAGIVALTDTIIAGHLSSDPNINTAASAAVGTMTYLQWFVGLMTSAFGVGATAIVARSIGAGRIRVANRVAGTSITSAFLVGLILAVLFFVFGPQIVHAMRLHGDAATFGIQFLRIMVITIALQTASQIGLQCIRGAGDTLRPMLITLTIVVLNIFTSISFSFGYLGMPAWGIRGIATGTMMAYLAGGILTTSVLLTGLARLKLQARHFRLVPHIISRVLKIGVPSWLESMLLWLGQFLIVIIVINPNDLAVGVNGATMTTHNSVLRIESFAFLPGFGFGVAAAALVGQYLGANRPDQARKAAYRTMMLAVATMTIAALPMILMPRFLLGLLVNASTVADLGVGPMILAGIAQPGFAVAIVMASSLRGAGETLVPMISTITGVFLVRIPILFACWMVFRYLGHPQWSLLAVWIAICVDLNYRALYNAIHFLRGRWQTKKV